MPTLVLAGSNSSTSINQHFAQCLAKFGNLDYLDTRTLQIPYYCFDIEQTSGIPDEIVNLYNTIRKYDKLIIVCPEYNGNQPAFIKSILDWLSRYNRLYLEDIEVVIVTVTPGQTGGASVRENLSKMLSFTNAKIINTIGIPHYEENNDYQKEYQTILNSFK